MNDMVKIDNDENTGAVVCEIIENKVHVSIHSPSLMK